MTSHSNLMVFLLVLACLVCLGQTKYWRVQVVNGLSSGHTLFLHCKSKDDDLGMHYLQVGSEFSWHFEENLWQSTLFWCNMRTDKAHASFNVFWLKKNEEPKYGSDFMENTCECFLTGGECNCIWTTKDDGIYLRNILENREIFMHKWEPGH
jgi:hypothetical protein